MSDYLARLPVELILEIFDYVSLVDILLSVSLVNKHLRLISQICRRSHLDFSGVNISIMSKSQFESVCSQMRNSTSQVVSLTLLNDEDNLVTLLRNNLFFSRFNIDDTTFPNLRSLTLPCMAYDTWRLFRTRLPPLITTLSVDLYALARVWDASSIFNGLLFLSPLLKRLTVNMVNVLGTDIQIRPPNSSMTSSIQYLRIKSVAINLMDLLAVVPMLHTIECEIQTDQLTLHRIYPRPLYLERLQIKLSAITMKKMMILVSSFPQLNSLVVIAQNVKEDMADGFKWARILQSIKYFEFKLVFSLFEFRIVPLCLDSFRTDFWTKEKKWFVTYDRSSWPVEYNTLYSNSSSYLFKSPVDIHGQLTSESTSSEPPLFPHAHNISIAVEHHDNISFLCRCNNIKTLDLPNNDIPLKNFNKLMSLFDASQITKCETLSKWSDDNSFRYIQFLRSLPCLRRLEIPSYNLNYFFSHQWPNITDLKIQDLNIRMTHFLSSKDIDKLCHSFRHVKRLDIHARYATDLRELIDKMRNILAYIFIRQVYYSKKAILILQWFEQDIKSKNIRFGFLDESCGSIGLWF